MAVWFDSQDLPQLARHFYRQSLEERNHAMMIVQYILDRDLSLTIPGVGEVRNDFTDVREPLALALSQEQEVTEQIKALFAAARAEGDALGEQFMLWFLKEQVEEVALIITLVNVAARADNLGTAAGVAVQLLVGHFEPGTCNRFGFEVGCKRPRALGW